VTIVGMILCSPLSPIAPLYRLVSLIAALSLLWHRRWFSLIMMAASVLAVPLLFALARFLLSGTKRMVMQGLRKRTCAI
jgi:hypothetical protein